MVENVEKNQKVIKNTINQLLIEYNRNSSELLDYIYAKIEIHEELSKCLNNLSLDDHDNKSNSEIDNKLTDALANNASLELTDLQSYISDDETNVKNEDGIIILDVQEYEITNGDSDTEFDSNEDNAAISDTEDKNEEFKNLNFVENDEIIDNYKLPEWFLEKYRCGMISPNLINVINFQRIFIPSQSEDYFSSPSHEICLPLLQFITGIVLGDRPFIEKVKCHARIRNMQIGVYNIIPNFEIPHTGRLPTLESVESLNVKSRTVILLKCLNLPEDIDLNLFPEEWKLFMITLLYWKKNCKHVKINGSHIRSIIICLIYLSIVDYKIGFSRSSTDLRKNRKETLKNMKLDGNENCEEESNDKTDANDDCHTDADEIKIFLDEKKNLTFTDYVNFVSLEDCFKFADALLQYHQISPYLLKNRKEFNVKLVHSFAQLQHCIQHIMTLNAVLNFPFLPCQPHLVFSGTFLYNLYSELNNRKLADGYITRTLLAKVNSIISLYRYLIASWETFSMKKILRPKLGTKKKKSKKKTCIINKTDKNEESNSCPYYDPENIYSMLPVE